MLVFGSANGFSVVGTGSSNGLTSGLIVLATESRPEDTEEMEEEKLWLPSDNRELRGADSVLENMLGVAFLMMVVLGSLIRSSKNVGTGFLVTVEAVEEGEGATIAIGLKSGDAGGAGCASKSLGTVLLLEAPRNGVASVKITARLRRLRLHKSNTSIIIVDKMHIGVRRATTPSTWLFIFSIQRRIEPSS